MLKKIGIIIKQSQIKSPSLLTYKYIKNKKYKKVIIHYKIYKIHDEQNFCYLQNKVLIVFSRPYSKHKNWIVEKKIK